MVSRKTRKWLIAAISLGAVLGVAVTVIIYLSYESTHVATDDAFIDGPIHYVTPQIGGRITRLQVQDNQHVQAGDVVAQLDDQELKTDLDIAQQNLTATEDRVGAQVASIAVVDAQIDSLQAQVAYAAKEKKRLAGLLQASAATQSQLDKATMSYASLLGQLAAAEHHRSQILAGLGSHQTAGKVAAVQLARAQLQKAQLLLSYATIHAPVTGYVTRTQVRSGQVVQPGQPLFAVVPLSDVYVTANYKETELTHVKPGQKVKIAIDAYPELHLQGRVQSIMAGSGSVFSLIPPENATGNYVKVVQRIPVRIALVNLPKGHPPPAPRHERGAHDPGRPAVSPADDKQPAGKWLVAATVMIPTAMEILDTSVANVALPHIQGALSAGVDEVTWVLTSYLVANAIVLPMTGWLAATFGRKRFLTTCVLGFTFASFLAGSAPSLAFLVTVRVMQGFFGGALQPMSQAILLETFPREEHGMAMGVFGMGIVAAPIFGPVLGGWITDHLSWRWIFYINVPVGILSAIAILAVVVDPAYLKSMRRRIDLVGMGLLAVGIGALQIMLDKGNRNDWFSSRFIIVCAALAAIGLGTLVLWELFGTDHPVMDLRAFGIRSFGIGCLVMFLVFASFFSSIVLLPLYLQELMGYTAFQAGIVLGPGGAVTIVAMPFVGKLCQMGYARRLLALGLVIAAVSVYLMSKFNLQADFWAILSPRIIQGLGLSMFFVPLTTLAVADIPRAQMGNATGLFNLVRNVGGAIGVSVASTMLARRMQFHQARIADHLGPINPTTRYTLNGIGHALTQRGIPASAAPTAALHAVYGQVARSSLMLSFNDAFYVLFLAVLVVLPLLFLFKRPAAGGPTPPVH